LVEEPDTQIFLVQNPPAIPTLVVCLLAAWWSGAAVIIDWHNLGFNMLDPVDANGRHSASNLKRRLARIAKVYEKYCGRLADAHLCVTKALSEWLDQNFQLRSRAVVVYDRPHSAFRRISSDERISILDKLSRENALPARFCDEVKNRRAALIVSSTSWTPDEDFSMFLDGLSQYAENAKSNPDTLPPVIAVVTGKGPLLKEYAPLLSEMEKTSGGYVRVLSAWLSHEDYPVFLAAADLGVCMHTSTSGLDLPMKVVDMFGAGLPACAVRFKCLNELVKDGVNGRIFSDAAHLANSLQQILQGFPANSASELEKLRQGLVAGGEGAFRKDWQENWEETVLPEVTRMLDVSRSRGKRRYMLPILMAMVGILASIFISLAPRFPAKENNT